MSYYLCSVQPFVRVAWVQRHGEGGGTTQNLTADDFSEDVATTLYPQSLAS